MKGMTWKKGTIALGGILLILMALDTVNQFRPGIFGNGIDLHSASSSILALLLIGMIIGLIGGVAIAFGYFMWRERNVATQSDDVSQLLEELSRGQAFFPNGKTSFEPDESKNATGDELEPWEKPTDWWKSEED